MFRNQRRTACRDLRFCHRATPSPSIAEPQLKKQVQFSRLRAAIVNGYLDQDVVRGSVEILDENVPVAIFIETSGIDQFELIVLKTAAAILIHQLRVWVGSLGVLIKHFEIGMVWRGVEVVIVFLDVFTVVALAVGKAEQPLF